MAPILARCSDAPSSMAFFREASTAGPRITCRRRERGPKDLRLSDHPSAHPGRCLSRRHVRRQVSWLADRRLARLPGGQDASSGFHGRDFPLTVAGAATDWGLIPAPYSLFTLWRGTVGTLVIDFAAPACQSGAPVPRIIVRVHVRRADTHFRSGRSALRQEPLCRKHHQRFAAALDLYRDGGSR